MLLSRKMRFLALAVLLLAAPPPARAQEPGPSQVHAAEQVLRPGDLVRLLIWREGDMSGDFAVNADGYAVLPRLGPVRVAGEVPEALRSDLITAYRKYLRNPSIEIVFLRRINVLGAVTRPGLYPVDATMTVADALALAGGTTPEAMPDRIELYRDGEPIATITGRTRIADSPIRSGDQLYVPARGWLSRNSQVLATAITGVVSLIILFTTSTR